MPTGATSTQVRWFASPSPATSPSAAPRQRPRSGPVAPPRATAPARRRARSARTPRPRVWYRSDDRRRGEDRDRDRRPRAGARPTLDTRRAARTSRAPPRIAVAIAAVCAGRRAGQPRRRAQPQHVQRIARRMRAPAERAERRELGVVAVDDVRRREPDVERPARRARRARRARTRVDLRRTPAQACDDSARTCHSARRGQDPRRRRRAVDARVPRDLPAARGPRGRRSRRAASEALDRLRAQRDRHRGHRPEDARRARRARPARTRSSPARSARAVAGARRRRSIPRSSWSPRSRPPTPRSPR